MNDKVFDFIEGAIAQARQQVPTPTSDEDQIRKFGQLLLSRGAGILELRVIGNKAATNWDRKQTRIAFYDNVDCFVRDCLANHCKHPVYVGLNPRNPALLHAAVANKLSPGEGAKADEVLVRVRLGFDIDTIRASSRIAASDSEIMEAAYVAQNIFTDFQKKGVEPVLGFSGNGAHLNIETIEYPNDKETNECFSLLLRYFNRKYGNERAKVDETTHDIGRVWKVYGTAAVKGANTTERPWRTATFQLPETPPEPVDILQIYKGEIGEQEFFELEKKPKHKSHGGTHESNGQWNKYKGNLSTLDIVGLFESKELYCKAIKNNIHAVECPWGDGHSCGTPGDGSTVIFESQGDKWPGFHCKHDHCSARKNADVFDFFGAEIVDSFCSEHFRRAGFEHGPNLNQQSAVWPTMEPLPSLEPEVPPLPHELIPTPFKGWMMDIAERMQVPLEYVAIPALIGTATAVGRQCGIRPKRNDSWLIVPNLWGAIVGRPGVLKTPTILEALKPLNRLAADARKEFEEIFQKSLAAHNSMVAQMKGLEDKIRSQSKGEKKGVPFESFEMLEKKMAELQEKADKCKVRERRYITNDSTPEKIADLLVENTNGLLMLRDELYGFLKNLDKPGYESARTFFLEAWSGTVEHYRVDRVIKGSFVVPALRLAVFGSIQPSRLRDYFSDALQGGSGDDGFIQRLQLLVYPPIPPKWKLVDRFPDKDEKDRAFRIFKKLSNFSAADVGAENDIYESVAFLRFSNEAQELFYDWLKQLEGRLRSHTITCAPFESHLAKYRSLMPSLALLFRLIDWANNETPGPVDIESAKLAAAWCDFLEAHAMKVYAGAREPEIASAHVISQKIKEGRIVDGDTLRDVYRHHWSQLDTAAKLDAGLAFIGELGWVRVELMHGATGAPREVIRLHPDLIKERMDG